MQSVENAELLENGDSGLGRVGVVIIIALGSTWPQKKA